MSDTIDEYWDNTKLAHLAPEFDLIKIMIIIILYHNFHNWSGTVHHYPMGKDNLQTNII